MRRKVLSRGPKGKAGTSAPVKYSDNPDDIERGDDAEEAKRWEMEEQQVRWLYHYAGLQRHTVPSLLVRAWPPGPRSAGPSAESSDARQAAGRYTRRDLWYIAHASRTSGINRQRGPRAIRVSEKCRKRHQPLSPSEGCDHVRRPRLKDQDAR